MSKVQCLFKFFLIALMGLAIASCANKSGQMASGGASSYGANGEGAYQDVGSNGQRHVNSMKAPSTQVYYFAFDGSTVSSSDYPAINVQAKYLATHPAAKVRLEGNTDDRGSREYNVGLGWRRAQAVARILKQQGVSPSQISMVSYGKERPVAVGDTEEAYSLNRRVVLTYENNG